MRRLNGTKVSHKLSCCLCNISAFSEFFCIYNSVICLIRCRKSRKFICMGIPVKIATVNDRTSDTRRMAIHIFCCRVGNNICSPLKRTAVNRCCKRIIHNKRNSVSVRRTCKFLKIKNNKSRIGNRLSKHRFCVFSKCSLQFFLRTIRIYKCSIYAHFFNCMSIKIICTAIQSRRAYDMVSLFRNVHNCIEIRRLSGRCQHPRISAFKIAYFGSNRIVRRILKTRIKISRLFKIKQSSHLLAARITKCSALINRKYSCFSVSGFISRLYTFCFDSVIAHLLCPPAFFLFVCLHSLNRLFIPVMIYVLDIIVFFEKI